MIPVRVWEVRIEKVKFYKCEQCTKAFLNNDDLVTHVKHHNDCFLTHTLSAFVKIEKVDIFNCDICRQGFVTKTESLLHRLDHIQKSVKNVMHQERINDLFEDASISKPYKCPECDYKFVAEATLKAHSVLHQPLPHICHCGIGYYKLQDLNQHQKLVHATRVNVNLKAENSNSIHKNDNIIKVKLPKKKKKKKSKQFNSQKVILPYLDIEIKQENNKYQCPECQIWCASKHNVKKHYRAVHRGERPYKCQKCHKHFTQKGALNIHLQRHSGLKIFKCQNCDKAFTTVQSLKRHEVLHTGHKPYSCLFCEKTFADPTGRAHHLAVHIREKKYRCSLCPKTYIHHNSFYIHKKTHENRKDYKCEKCSKAFYTRSNLKKHVSAVHYLICNFICDYCDKKFSVKSNLSSHIQRNHTQSIETRKCLICYKTMSKYHLKRHIKFVHENIREFTCDYCARQFSHKCILLDHLAMHTKSKIFECHDCSKQFYTKQSLSNHITKTHVATKCKLCRRFYITKSEFRNHKLKKSEDCGICDKVFFCKGVLDAHLIRIHINPRNSYNRYECDYCSCVFTKKARITDHILIHHSKPKYTCEHCGQKFALKDQIRCHIMRQHLDILRCNICYKTFCSQLYLKRHQKTKCSRKKYNCKICGTFLLSKYALKKHLESHKDN